MLSKVILALGSLAAATAALPSLESRQAYGMAGIGYNDSTTTLGNVYNYWRKYPNATFDLTRSDVMPVTSPKMLPFSGKRTSAIIEPSRTVLCIIDMQNYFLHPKLAAKADSGRAAVPPTLDMIKAFRDNGMKIIWVNWGLTEYDILTISPAHKSSFSGGTDENDKSFGSDMGVINDNGTEIQVGAKLTRNQWNSEPWGELGVEKDKGVAAGTDFVFYKNRQSGLWGPQTPFGLWLQENEITTIFFGGVNADQCVWSTLQDAFFKGYDTIYVEDMSATTSPEYATQMVLYNANSHGFLANSSAIVGALDSQAC